MMNNYIIFVWKTVVIWADSCRENTSLRLQVEDVITESVQKNCQQIRMILSTDMR